MKTLMLTLSFLLSTLSFAQSNPNADVENALKQWKSNDKETLKIFEKIKVQHPNNRLVKYYLALTKTVNAFEEHHSVAKEKLVNEAAKEIEDLMKAYPNDPEILNLKALNLSAEIMLNPRVNGMLLMQDVQSIYAQSILLNPNNPRSILGNAEFNINTAKFMGGDIAKDCKAVRKALALLATENKNSLEPSWGKERAENLLNNECKSF